MAVAEMVPTRTPTRAESAPLPPLTREHCDEVIRQLRAYLSEAYAQFRFGWPMPSFRMVWRSFPPDEVPRASAVTRRSEGTHSDPTALTAIGLAEGVSVRLPETVNIPAAVFDAYLAAMPAHLRAVLVTIVIPVRSFRGVWETPGTVYSLQLKLAVSQATVYRRLDEALAWLGMRLYAERWPGYVADDGESRPPDENFENDANNGAV